MDRVINNVCDLGVEGESYRLRLKPNVTDDEAPPRIPITKPDRPIRTRRQ